MVRVCKHGPLLHICPCPGPLQQGSAAPPTKGQSSFIAFQIWASLGTLLGLQIWHKWWSAGSQPKASQRRTRFYSRRAPAVKTHLGRWLQGERELRRSRHPSWPAADHRDVRNPNSEESPSRVQPRADPRKHNCVLGSHFKLLSRASLLHSSNYLVHLFCLI